MESAQRTRWRQGGEAPPERLAKRSRGRSAGPLARSAAARRSERVLTRGKEGGRGRPATAGPGGKARALERLWVQELGKTAPRLGRLRRLWREGGRQAGAGALAPWGLGGLMACAQGCQSEAVFRWLDRRGAQWGARDDSGEGVEHKAARGQNGAALRFWRGKGFSIARRDKGGRTAFEAAMESSGWGAELMLRMWPGELGERQARSALYKTAGKAGAGVGATLFATVVGLICRERPGAIAPDRRLSSRWGALFPGPMRTPKMMLEELENQSMARWEAGEIEAAMDAAGPAKAQGGKERAGRL